MAKEFLSKFSKGNKHLKSSKSNDLNAQFQKFQQEQIDKLRTENEQLQTENQQLQMQAQVLNNSTQGFGMFENTPGGLCLVIMLVVIAGVIAERLMQAKSWSRNKKIGVIAVVCLLVAYAVGTLLWQDPAWITKTVLHFLGDCGIGYGSGINYPWVDHLNADVSAALAANQ